MEHEITVTLSKPVQVGIDGIKEDCYEIHLTGPSGKNRKEAAALKAMWEKSWTETTKSFVDLPKEEKDALKEKAEEKSEAQPSKKFSPMEAFTAKEVVNTIAGYSGNGVNELNVLDVAVGHLEKLLIDGCGDFQGVAVTSRMFNGMALRDIENILGDYVKAFLLDSLFN